METEQMKAFKESLYGMQQYRICQQEITKIEQRLSKLDDEVEMARRASRKKEQDVVELEHSGVHKVLLKVTGKYNAAKDKEDREAKEAQIVFGTKVLEVEELEKALEDWKQKQRPFIDCEKKSKELFKNQNVQFCLTMEMKEALIEEYEYKCAELKDDIEVVRKVVNLGYGVSDELKKIEKSLQDAETKGLVDIYGRNQRAGVPKQLQIMDAESRWDGLQKLLCKLQKEAQRVNRELSVSEGLKIEAGAMFADVFLDSLFADIKMQKQIQTSEVNIHKLRQKIDSMVKQLIKRTAGEKLKIREYEKQIEELKKDLES